MEPEIDADAEMDVVSPVQTQTQLPPTTTAAAEAPRKRPRLDLTAGTRERRKGKSIFGLVIGTLNKAKVEDKERMASEAVGLSIIGDREKHTDRILTGQKAYVDRCAVAGQTVQGTDYCTTARRVETG